MARWYSVNTLSVTNGSAVVTGDSTQFTTFVKLGWAAVIEGAIYEVLTVDSPTQITLAEPYVGPTQADARYAVFPTQGIMVEVWESSTELIETFGPLRNNMNLLNEQITGTADAQQAAAASAAAALQSEGNSAASAWNASNSATAASGHKDAAAASAVSANSSKNAAATSAGNAATSAGDANTYRGQAAVSAGDAATAKAGADQAKLDAEVAAASAQGSASASGTARDASVVAQGLSEAAAEASIEAKEDSQAAQIAAEQAEADARSHKNAAAGSATAAADSEAYAADHMAGAQTARGASETARDASIAASNVTIIARDTTFGYLNQTEQERIAAENARDAAELAASIAQEPVTSGAIEVALGGHPALLEGATFTGSIASIAGNQLLLKNGSSNTPTAIHRNDGSNYYFLLSDPATAPSSTWNALRPLTINMTSGYLSSANGQSFAGGTTISGGLAVAALTATPLTATKTTNDADFSELASFSQANTASTSTALRFVQISHNVGGIEVLNQAATGGTLHLQPYGGAVVAPGDFYAGTNAGHGIMLGADGAIEMWRSNGQPYIDFKTSSGQDYQVRLQADGANAKLSLTGNFGVYRPSNDTILTIGADNGKYKYIRLTNAGTPRWDFGGDNVADAAGNAGSNFFINSFDNSGVYTRTPFTIQRSTGWTAINYGLDVTNGMNVLGTRAGNSAMANATGGLGEIELRGNGTGAALMTFHRPGSYAAYIGIDTDNFWKVGGWSMGAASYKIYHEGAKPAKSDVGLGNVDNTSDANKPISTATQNALNGKLNTGGGTMTGQLTINNGSPTLYLQDTDHYSAMLHCNDNTLYVLRGGVNTTAWEQVGGYWPLAISLVNNDITMGGNATVRNSLYVSPNGATGGGIILADDGDIVDLNDGFCAMRFSNGVRIHGGNRSGAANITLGNGGNINAAASITGSEIYSNNWLRVVGNGGVYWETHGRGLQAANAGSNYGNVATYGTGYNGWSGYSIANWISFMANGTGAGSTRGFYSADNGGWLLSWDSGNNAVFPANITAYSDERLKKNKRPINNVAARVAGMAKAAMLYERDGKTRVGFGAQTLEKAVPECVFTADDLVGTKSVNYPDMIAILAVQLQELTEKIEALEAQKG